MSFTEDELQSFNAILEQKLSAHRREMERSFEQHLNLFRRDLEQRLLATQQEVTRNLSLKLTEHQGGLDSLLSQKLNVLQTRITQAMNSHSRQQEIESILDRKLAPQLTAIEQLPCKQAALHSHNEHANQVGGSPRQLESIEVQTELPWEDLLDVIGKALDERLTLINSSIQVAIRNLEQYLSARLHTLREEFFGQQAQHDYRNHAPLQEVMDGIERLEHIIESMQVAMTSNDALLSNRLYHHQQLPIERAHPLSLNTAPQPNGKSNPDLLTKELPDLSQPASEEHIQ